MAIQLYTYKQNVEKVHNLEKNKEKELTGNNRGRATSMVSKYRFVWYRRTGEERNRKHRMKENKMNIHRGRKHLGTAEKTKWHIHKVEN